MNKAVGKQETVVVMRDIVKKFPGVIANAGVDLSVYKGEIHALLGENGAGKTTLMNILYGIYQQDEGKIWVNGESVAIKSPQDAIKLGIGMIHQHFRLVITHTVAENVILGLRDRLLFPARAAEKRIRDLSTRYGIKVDPNAYIWQLSAGEQQRVEILKALFRGARILILDEPTSMLTPQETEELLATLRQMTQEGYTIIFITHKLDEVIEFSDRVTVLRQGKVVSTLETSRSNPGELAKLMVGREVIFRVKKKEMHRGDVVLEIKNLSTLGDKLMPAVKNVSLSVYAGETLGIAGVAGNGQRELVEAVTGLRPVIEGRIILKGTDITRASPRKRIDLGLGSVPGERMIGLVPNMTVADNLILKSYLRPEFNKSLFMDQRSIREHVDRLIQEYSILTPSRETPVKLLSGGNIQRVLLARELSDSPPVLIATHPTSGLDVGAIEYIWDLLIKERDAGRAILLISEDLEEIMALSDRIAVMFEGEVVGIVKPQETTPEQIGLLMAGGNPGSSGDVQ